MKLLGDKSHTLGMTNVYLCPLKNHHCFEKTQPPPRFIFPCISFNVCNSPTKQIQWLGDDFKYNQAKSKIQPDF
jgi:hypothetical protein